MKVSRLEKSYVAILMVVFAGIVVHAPLSVGLGTLFPGYSLLIKSWKEILLICATFLAIIIVTRYALWRELLRDRLFQLIAAYTSLHVVLTVLFYQGAGSAAAGLAIDLRYVLFFSLVYVALWLFPRYKRRMLQVVVIGAWVVVGFATLQLFLPADILSHIGYSKDTIMPYLTVDRNHDFIRVNSTLRGPNPLGAYAGMVLGLLTAALVRKRFDLSNTKVRNLTILFAACSTIALWISYSRSALVAGLIIVLVVLFISVLRKLPRRTWMVICIAAGVLVGGLIVGRDSALVSNIVLHESPTGGSSVNSNEAHAASLSDGIYWLIRQPLGGGIGSTGSASLYGNEAVIIENQYLFVAHETGWLGLLLFMMIVMTILTRLWPTRRDWLSLGVFSSGIGLGLIGLLLPVWADDTVSIVWWGLAAIALAGGTYAPKSTK